MIAKLVQIVVSGVAYIGTICSGYQQLQKMEQKMSVNTGFINFDGDIHTPTAQITFAHEVILLTLLFPHLLY